MSVPGITLDSASGAGGSNRSRLPAAARDLIGKAETAFVASPAAANSFGGRQSSGFTGTTAEFILERPTDTASGNPFPLAAFGFTTMEDCWYGDSEYGFKGWQLGPAGSTPFDASLTYLNMTNSSSGLLAIPFSFPDPTTPGDTEILWLWLNYS